MRKYCYEYPRPMVTVDAVVFCKDVEDKILLIERKNEPFAGKWALPGGFLDMDEEISDAAYRELEEETGIVDVPLTEFKTYGSLGRDPRGRTISVVFIGDVKSCVAVQAGDDAARAKWFSMNQLPGLAFDHDIIIREAYSSWSS